MAESTTPPDHGDRRQELFLSPEAGGDDLSLVRVAAALMRQLPVVLGTPVVLLLVILGVALVRGFDYTAESMFRPEASEQGGQARISSLAAQFGVNLGGSQGDNVDFYEQLLRARHLLLAAATTEYEFEAGGDTLSGTLAELLDVDGRSEELRNRNAAMELRSASAVETNTSANTVILRVTMPWPELAVAVNRRLLELVNEFNLEQRQNAAAAERTFAEARAEDARGDLQAAEDSLRDFLERNRLYQQSPELQFEAARLQRAVSHHEQVYTSLAVAAEQAGISEVRNTPVITIVDPPEGFVRRTGNYVQVGLLAIVLGLILGVLIGLAREYGRWQADANPRDLEELRSATRGLRTRVASLAGKADRS